MINIAIADDEQLFRKGLTSLLKGYDINVICEASNGKEIIEKLKTITPDLVLLDLNMPILNGSLVLDELQKFYPGIKIIILSSYHDEQIIFDHFNRGAMAYVSKAEEINILVEAIKSVSMGYIYKKNIGRLLKIKIHKDGHYYKLLFTHRELEIIHYLCSAMPVKDIAIKMNVSQKTTETHLTEIYKKLNVKNRFEFLRMALKNGFEYFGMPAAE